MRLKVTNPPAKLLPASPPPSRSVIITKKTKRLFFRTDHSSSVQRTILIRRKTAAIKRSATPNLRSRRIFVSSGLTRAPMNMDAGQIISIKPTTPGMAMSIQDSGVPPQVTLKPRFAFNDHRLQLTVNQSPLPVRGVAEREGFEPSVGYKPTHAFQACAFNRSATSPF